MDFLRGFEFWRELGESRSGDAIPFAALTAIHYTHRLFAYVVLLALGWLAWRLWTQPETRGVARWVLILAAWQLLTGVSNVVLEWPLLAAVSHTGGAAGLVIVLTGVLAAARRGDPAHVPFPSSTVSRPA